MSIMRQRAATAWRGFGLAKLPCRGFAEAEPKPTKPRLATAEAFGVSWQGLAAKTENIGIFRQGLAAKTENIRIARQGLAAKAEVMSTGSSEGALAREE